MIKSAISTALLLGICLGLSAQWSPDPTKTDFITTTHTNAVQDFGLNLESSGGTYRYLIHNNITGGNQQALYFGQANSSKNIFGISSSTNSGTTWSPKFVITQTGSVGFNTNTPSTNFHVNGQVRLNPGLNNNNYVSFRSSTSSQMNMVFFSENSARWNFYTASDGKFYFRRTDNNPNGGVKMTLDGDNVGIGTSTPQQKLQVHGSTLVASNKGYSGITDTGTYGSAAGLFLGNAGSILDNDNQALNIVSRTNLEFVVNEISGTSLQAMYIKSNGKVGIGTTSPDAKLTVKGDIHAEEVKVDLSVPGPDYVFKEDYPLKSLQEVQDYIKEHGHLPNIPSAKKMEEEGIDLGTMNMNLLEKIEELTLYLLDQNNKIEKLNKANEILVQRIGALERKR